MSKNKTRRRHLDHDGQYQMCVETDAQGKETIKYLTITLPAGKASGLPETLLAKGNQAAEGIEWTKTNNSGYTDSANDAKYQAPKMAERIQAIIEAETKREIAVEVIRATCPGLRDNSKKGKDKTRVRPAHVVPKQGRKGVYRVYVHGNTEKANLGSVMAWAAHIIITGKESWSVKGGQAKKSPEPQIKMDIVGIGEVKFKDYASYLAFLASQTKFTMNPASVDACERYRKEQLGKKVDESLQAYNKVSIQARKARRDERRLNGTRGASRSTVHSGVAA